jgi:hypothetical protein
MANVWFITEHLVADHQLALESAADRRRLIRSIKSVDEGPRRLRRRRHPTRQLVGSLQHRAV